MLTIFGLVGLIALIVYQVYSVSYNKEARAKIPQLNGKMFGILLLLFVFFIVNPFTIVPAGNKGVITTFGKVTGECNAGLKMILPIIQKVNIITLKPVQVNIKIPVGINGAITKDNQTVGVEMIFFYQYDPTKIKEVFKDFGEDRLTMITKNAGTECIKFELGKHAIFEIPVNQNQIQVSTIGQLKDKLNSYPVIVTDLKIVNYDWSDEFDKQIQETMHRAQQVRQKEQELLITEQESQKKVKLAEADKQALIATAEGEKAAALLRADAKAAEGEGIRKYNELVAKNMSLEIEIRKLEIEKIKAEKWNGVYVPTNNYGPIPVQTGSLLGK